MKTTLEIPDQLFKRAKATAAIRGEKLKDLFTEALEEHLQRHTAASSSEPTWRSVFGQVGPEDVLEVDVAVETEFEQIDPETLR